MIYLKYFLAFFPFALSFYFKEYTFYIITVYLLMSLITILLYFIDKRKAVKGNYRIPESKLHLAELLFGWPGAVFAQRLFRHKNLKRSYQIKFILIVFSHIILWGTIIFNREIFDFIISLT